MASSNPIMDTSEVNPVDFFVEGKISFSVLMYKLMCGALVTIIALRLSAALEVLSLELTTRANFKNKIVKTLFDILITMIILVVFVLLIRLRVASGNLDISRIKKIIPSQM